MIEPSGALRGLLDQHEALREMMDDCEQVADDVDRGGRQIGELVRKVAKLRVAFQAHNEHEEAVLPPLLRQTDSFGGVRVDRMLADHIDEHLALRRDLDGPTGELRATLYKLRAHLATEERYFLSARVLRDDVVNVKATS